MKWDPSKRKGKKKPNAKKADIVDTAYDILMGGNAVYKQTFEMHGWDKKVKKKARQGLKAIKKFGSHLISELNKSREEQAKKNYQAYLDNLKRKRKK